MIASLDSFFDTVKEDFLAYKDAGFFETAEEPLFVVYTIVKANHIYHGIIAANDLLDIDDGKILKHEKTLAHKEQHMIRLTLERRAQIKPVLLGYHAIPEIDAFMAKVTSREPDYSLSFSKGREVHQLYAVKGDREIHKLQKLFGKIPRVYIADGHHRCATGQHLSSTEDQMGGRIHVDSLLAMYLPFSDLEIYDFNRIIDVSESVSTSRLVAMLSRVCHIYPLKRRRKPQQNHEMTCCIEGHWYRLRWKKKIIKRKKGGVLFDTALLNEYVLRDILHITDVRADPHIEYRSGVTGLKAIDKIVQSDHDKVAFCLFPVRIADLVATADAGNTLPPKSTWFEPRIKNGVVGIEI